MKSRGPSDCGPNSITERPPDLRNELRPTVRDNVLRDAVQLEDVAYEEVCSFLGGRELGKGHKIYCF